GPVAEHGTGEILELLAQGAAADAVIHRPVGGVGRMQLVAIDDGEVGEGVLHVNDAFGADDRHPLVDVERGLLGHAPDGFEGGRGATLEAVHGLADVWMLEPAHVDGLRIGGGDGVAGEPEHDVGVVDGVADDRADLFEDGRGPGGGDVATRAQRHHLADAALVDRLFRHAVAGVEANDVTDEELALRGLRCRGDGLGVGDGRGDGLFEEHVLAGFERGDGRFSVLVPHGADGDGVDLGVGKHLVIVAIELLDAELLPEGGEALAGARAQRMKFETGNASDGLAVDFTEPSEADDADTQPIHAQSFQKSSRVSSRAITMLPAVRPQSTGMTAPVMALAASEARKAITRATSSGSTMRPSGYQRSRVLRTCGSFFVRSTHSGVRTVPGRTTLARMPWRPYSSASARVIEIIPALAAL